MANLYLMLGNPGAGKTTTAKIIQEITGAKYLSSDELRLEWFKKPVFSEQEHDELYQKLDLLTEKLLLSKKSVIYDANLNRYQHRKDKYEICQRTGANPVLVWVQTPRSVAKQRAIHDSRSHLWPKTETPHDMFERIADLIENPLQSEKYIEIDGTKVTKDYIEKKLNIARESS